MNRTIQPPTPAYRRRVCFVTLEFHGLFKNGGIGTANTSLALALAAKGFDVTVVIPNADASGPRLQTGDFETLKADYARLGVTLDYVRPHPHIASSLDEPRTISYCVFLYLQQGGFDVVLFNDNGGHAYYSVLAKYTGVFERPPLLCVVAHGPLEWVNELNMSEFQGRVQVAVDHMERSSIRLADVLISPSQYLLDWMTSHEWTLPNRSGVIQNLVDVRTPESRTTRAANSHSGARSAPVREIVFFGRLETRKGISLFCDALDRLDQSADLSAVTVTFLGKFHRIGSVHSGVYIVERGRAWKAALRILSGYDQSEALDYLRRPGTLAVIPSRAENSPCVVAECVQLGIPFLAADSGGTAELIAPEHRGASLFAPEAGVLAERLGEVLRVGHVAAHLAISQETSLEQWVELLSGDGAAQSAMSSRAPLVSACLVWSDSDAFRTCLASLAQQSYARLEIVVVAPADHPGANAAGSGAGLPDTAEIPHRFLEVDSASRVGLRNEAGQLAAGEYLLFIDESVTSLAPHAVETFVAAGNRTDADVLTALRMIGADHVVPKAAERLWAFPIGSCLALGALENCFGEGAFLVKASFFRASDGFSSADSDPTLTWAFLARAALAGASLELIPSPIIEIGELGHAISRGESIVADRRQVLQVYGDASLKTVHKIFESLLDVGRVSQLTAQHSLQSLSGPARELATRLSRMDPSGREAGRAFVEYCCARRAVDLALDFALHNDVEFLEETIEAARRATEEAALDVVRTTRLRLWHTIDLSEGLHAKSSLVRCSAGNALVPLREGSIQHPAVAGDCVVRVAAACPPGTGSILVTVLTEGSGAAALAAAVQDSRRAPPLSADHFSTNGGVWSGWVFPAPGSPSELSIVLPEPASDALDLFLLARREPSASLPPLQVTWQRLTAAVSVSDSTSRHAAQRPVPMSRLSSEHLINGEVLTNRSGVSFEFFKPGERTLLHPIPDRLALVRIPQALPPLARGLRCGVSLENEKSHPIEFGVWLRSTTEPAKSQSELTEDQSFSGWLRVEQPLKQHTLTFLLPEPDEAAKDIYLATRVVGFKDVNYCHAFWHDFWIFE
jgi:O-antigen biosynthesis protein